MVSALSESGCKWPVRATISARKHRAFTLIELMIVVAILGILAAIVYPFLTDATDEARVSSTLAQLHTLRGAIVRYRSDHGADPDMTDWSDLISGGYVPADPLNPNNNFSSIAASAAANVGWVWRAKGGGDPTMELYATADDGTSEFAE
jgi:prepilin-type N-terminal cleavage/methylation domain-containing protein